VVLWVLQALWDEVCGLRAGDSPNTGGAPRPGQRLPPAVLCVRHVQPATEYGRRVLSYGGPEARLQA